MSVSGEATSGEGRSAIVERAGDQLLERDAELGLFDTLVRAVPNGQGRLVVVEGPAGAGKTSLLQEARWRALAAGMEVASARSSELERDFPFGVVRQLFEPRLAAASGKDREALLSGPARFAQAALADGALEAPEDVEDHGLLATLHGVYRLAANVAAVRPLFIGIDDAQWSDTPSLRWLAYLVKRVEALPALVVVTATPMDPGGDQDVLEEIAADPLAVVMRPAPLSQETVAQLVRASISPDADEEFSSACFGATQGSPFLVRELLSELAAEGANATAQQAPHVALVGPKSVSRAMLRRMSRLGHEACLLARAVAIFGDRVERRRAAALAGLDERSAAAAASVLARVEILRDEEPLGFVHPIVGSAIYSDVDFSDRQQWHTRAARLLHDEGATRDEVDAHLLTSEPSGDRWVADELHEAARQALESGAPDHAAAYLTRALAEPPPSEACPELLRELGMAELHSLGSGSEHLGRALELTDDPSERARLALELARAQTLEGRPLEAVSVLERTIAETHDADDRAQRAELEAELTNAALADPAGCRLARERLADREPAHAPAARAFAHAAAGGSCEEASELAKRALADASAFEHAAWRSFWLPLSVLVWCEEFEVAGRLADEALANCPVRGSGLVSVTALCVRAQAAYRRGMLAEAEAEGRAALDLLPPDARAPELAACASAVVIASLTERGALDSAEAMLDESDAAGDLAELWEFNALLHSRAVLRMAQGRADSALADLTECGRRLSAWGAESPAVLPWRSNAALCLAVRGDADDARRIAAEEVELARAIGAPRALGVALRAAALVETREHCLELLSEAVATLERSAAELELARALVDLGAALRRAGRRSAARSSLRRGVAGAERAGATSLSQRGHEELVVAGARPRRAMVTGAAALTACERRVAELAVQGMTNREIAHSLFVTEKTVEAHLSHAYQKLDIGSRTQLEEALERPVPL